MTRLFRTHLNIHRVVKCVFLGALPILAACPSPRPIILPPPPLSDRIPSPLLACRDRPLVGALDRQSDVAKWVVELDAAGDDCRRKIQAIRGLVERDGRKEGERK